MFREIFHFLINISTNLLGEALILRVWLGIVNVPCAHPMMIGLTHLTDWLLRPLYRLRIVGRWHQVDLVALLSAWMVALLNLVIIATLFGFVSHILFPQILISSFFLLCKWILNLISWSTILYILISWINPFAPSMVLISILLNPLLLPFRKLFSYSRIIDFSPIILTIVIAILQTMLTRLWANFPHTLF